MKKLIYFLSILFLLIQSCSYSDCNNNTDTNTVSDVDGNIYQTVTICNQTWTKSNLNVSKYRNGDVIPQVQDATQWASLTTGAWCYYNNDPANGAIYGKLYNWYAVNDSRGLAPSGYHIPTDAEWTTLTTCLGGVSVAGGNMKEVGTIHWNSPNSNATNSSGFTGLPGANRGNDGNYYFLGGYGNWWSSTLNTPNNPWSRALGYNTAIVGINDLNSKYGFSIRCIKD